MPFDGNVNADAFALQTARQRLIEKGWCVGDQHDREGRHCAIGAITYSRVAASREDEERLWARLARVVERHHPEFKATGYGPSDDGWTVANFNNAQTSIEPILELYDEAIAECR